MTHERLLCLCFIAALGLLGAACTDPPMPQGLADFEEAVAEAKDLCDSGAPPPPEVCGDQIDNDCDKEIDEGCPDPDATATPDTDTDTACEGPAPPDDDCLTYICTDGTWTADNEADGAECDDDDLCTEVDACQSGECVGESPLPDQDGDGLCDIADTDLDGDGVPNADDTCPLLANSIQALGLEDPVASCKCPEVNEEGVETYICTDGECLEAECAATHYDDPTIEGVACQLRPELWVDPING